MCEPVDPRDASPFVMPDGMALVVGLTAAMAERLQERAHRDGTTPANVTRKALLRYLDAQRRPQS